MKLLLLILILALVVALPVSTLSAATYSTYLKGHLSWQFHGGPGNWTWRQAIFLRAEVGNGKVVDCFTKTSNYGFWSCNFSAELPKIITLRVRQGHSLEVVRVNVLISEFIEFGEIPTGDTNWDNIIDSTDLFIWEISNGLSWPECAWEKTCSAMLSADVNDDGYVNEIDRYIIMKNMGERGPIYR